MALWHDSFICDVVPLYTTWPIDMFSTHFYVCNHSWRSVLNAKRTRQSTLLRWQHISRYHICTLLWWYRYTIVNIRMGWLWLVGSLKLQVSFAQEPYKRDYILQKRPNRSHPLHHTGCPRLVGSIKLYNSFAEYPLFYRALLQKSPMI